MHVGRWFNRAVMLVPVLAAVVFPPGASGTALDDYVAAPDASYSYSIVNVVSGFGYTAYVIDLTSQTWRSSAEVDRPEWHHWLTVVVPAMVVTDKALLLIDGGDNGGAAPTEPEAVMVQAALATLSVVAYLPQVPNQPLAFADETRTRREDAIIAYSFDKYLTTGDGSWPALLPMVKSAVRAMDTVQAVVSDTTGGTVAVKHFMVTGASKRGWTTWLTAAVDPRVVAIAPLVIDMLNLDEQMDHHYAAYGFYAPAVGDYEEMSIFERMYTPGGQALLEIVDPYEYRDRYASVPAFAINSTGDQFFLPDSAQFYFDDLPGEKYIRYIPNTDHGLNEDAVLGGIGFYSSVLTGAARPEFSWSVAGDHSITVQAVSAPSAVTLWQATATGARDFRLETISAAWTSSPLADQGGGVYVARPAEPEAGWTAYFVELTYSLGGPFPCQFTTEIRVIPPTLPYAPDMTHDGKVYADDFMLFQACVSGANVERSAGRCVVADLDADGDVDQSDFGLFQRCLSGPASLMDPACMLGGSSD